MSLRASPIGHCCRIDGITSEGVPGETEDGDFVCSVNEATCSSREISTGCGSTTPTARPPPQPTPFLARNICVCSSYKQYLSGCETTTPLVLSRALFISLIPFYFFSFPFYTGLSPIHINGSFAFLLFFPPFPTQLLPNLREAYFQPTRWVAKQKEKNRMLKKEEIAFITVSIIIYKFFTYFLLQKTNLFI